ncbi:sensor histidine kinase [Priestia taiwanensis]|uniref:histidine kinase n=1 Tax=Priestia taiwanensis TaxID=1347902 RepID=A0A917ESS2_9BACI|nr:HAMP domain-containing sensor histidine kinase [Priestia taiwanensis]MBM7365068.1 signal transduction histidine kinase [Priestia taiwanensis]GGE83812.1 two-component sensor histidine kinase [Priestia taiwanensis]
MSLKRKLTQHFVIHFILTLVIIISFITGALVYLSFNISQSEMESNFKMVSEEYLEHAITVESGSAVLNDKVKESVLSKGGWLQIIDQTGKVIGKWNTPEEVPDFYDFTDILSIDSSKYRTYHWEINAENGTKVTVLYGERLKSKEILSGILSMETFLKINEATQRYLSQNDAWVQAYNSQGKVVKEFQAPPDLQYTFNDILSIEKEPWNSEYDISTYYDKNADYVYVIGTKNVNYSPEHITDEIINGSLLKSLGIITLIIIILIIGLSFWYGQRFGVPLLYMMKRINNMSEGKLEEPKNKKGKISILNKDGNLNKKYKIFNEVFTSLDTLAFNLKKNEELQIQMNKTREEWIAGLSHDLKTPLSSIYGYAVLLESEAYNWSKEETINFGNIIKEKSEYMNELIEDLNLTYRLKNNGLPIKKENHNITSLLQEIVVSFTVEENYMHFEHAGVSLFLEVDIKWFTRIINNLLANAIKHNPRGTEISIKVEQSNLSTTIVIEDNGIGMDKETVDNLFNRYYRGGNTMESDNGSGLGMAIAHQLVVAHGGDVMVISEENKGTVVKLTFYKNKTK